MKKLQIIIALLGFIFFNIQHTQAQKKNNVQEKVYKTTVSKSPQKVKDALQSYSDYRISDNATYIKKNNSTIYKIQVTKRNWSHFLLINENGKIIGIDDGEHAVVSN